MVMFSNARGVRKYLYIKILYLSVSVLNFLKLCICILHFMLINCLVCDGGFVFYLCLHNPWQTNLCGFPPSSSHPLPQDKKVVSGFGGEMAIYIALFIVSQYTDHHPSIGICVILPSSCQYTPVSATDMATVYTFLCSTRLDSPHL